MNACLISYQNVSFFNCFFSARADHTEEERERIRHSLEILEKMSKAPDSKEEQQRREEEKEQLRAWMMEKRHQRMEEYKKHMTDLREHERRPFKPNSTSKFKVTHIHTFQHLFVKFLLLHTGYFCPVICSPFFVCIRFCHVSDLSFYNNIVASQLLLRVIEFTIFNLPNFKFAH